MPQRREFGYNPIAMQIKAQLATGTRRCQLCHIRQATDLHHIISRGHVPKPYQDHIPREYMALICNKCNLNEGEIAADGLEGRKALIQHNVEVYGLPRMREALDKFTQVLLDNRMTPLYEIEAILDELETGDDHGIKPFYQ